MPSSSTGQVTQLLVAWGDGDRAALDQLVSTVHEKLHRLARRRLLQEGREHTLQTTALVNEAYLRLVDVTQVKWQDRAHFFAIASRMMRRILVDYARRRRSAKRGGDAILVSFDEAGLESRSRAADVLALDDALSSLAKTDSRKAEMVELRFFAGLSIEEAAEVLQVSPGTVMRDWTLAKAWLQREMRKQKPKSA